MNFLLAQENAENHTGTKTCFYCNKSFTNYRALGGHLRIHPRSLNHPGRSSTSMDVTGNPPVSLPNSQQICSGGGNNPTPFTRAPRPFEFSRMFCSNETNQGTRSQFTGINPGVTQTPFVMPPDFSYGSGSGPTYDHAMSSAAFAPFGSVAASGFPVAPCSHLGSTGVCQFNTDEFQIGQDGLPPSSGDALQEVQGYNHGFPPHSSPDKVGQSDGQSLMTRDKGKRPYFADGSGDGAGSSAEKKAKVDDGARVEPENPEAKELTLFMDVDDSLSALEAGFGAGEEEGPGDIDLTLHL